MNDLPMLSSAEAAARLGVQLSTLYAYVSRGLLARARRADGSWFDPLDVERFAAARRPAARPAREPGAQPGSPLMVLDTALTLIEDDHLYFRGRDAVELAAQGFEATAAWIWGALPTVDRAVSEQAARVVSASVRALPPNADVPERMLAGVVALAAADPFRHDPTPANAVRIGALLLDALPVALGSTAGAPQGSVAARVLAAYGAQDDAASVRAVDAALALAVDHDLAVSTLAARVAASARASAYACVTAALGAFDSPLHGAASLSAAALMRAVVEGRAVDDALSAALRANAAAGLGGVPGFGHRLYAGQDPRATAVLRAVGGIPGAEPVVDAAGLIAATVRARVGVHPNIDHALAALVLATGMPDGAGTAVFGMGRTVGWIGHVVEEYGQTAMRLRPHGRYAQG